MKNSQQNYKSRLVGRLKIVRVLLILFISGVCIEYWAFNGESQAAVAEMTFLVNSELDSPDADPGNGVCQTQAATCTLRAALEESNSYLGHHTIQFAAGYEIIPAEPLPALNNPAGTTIKNDTGVNVVLYGSQSIGVGLHLASDLNVVMGLEISGFETGILVTGNSNRIGTDGDGSGDEHEGNLISGNLQEGIRISGGDQNLVMGNKIGTDAAGNAPGSDQEIGVRVMDGARHNQVGTNGDGLGDSAEGNLISGNLGREGIPGIGVSIEGLGTAYNAISGNWVGVDSDGSDAVPNSIGIVLESAGFGNIIGAGNNAYNGVPLEGNLISGNLLEGIRVNSQQQSTVIAGNRVGLAADGQGVIPNRGHGILVQNSSNLLIGVNQNVVGDVYEQNWIAGNVLDGLHILDSHGIQIRGNGVGVSPDYLPAGNRNGAWVGGYSYNIEIGGYAEAVRNVIAFNSSGVVVTESAEGVLLQTNKIYNNTDLGIDLGGDQVTLNDPGDIDVGANYLQNYPEITSAAEYLEDQLAYTIRLESTPMTDFEYFLFANKACDPSGFGEGEATQIDAKGYLSTDSINGLAEVEAILPAFGPEYAYLTAYVTRETDGSTSEFSTCTLIQGVEPLPALSVADVTVFEGNAGTSEVDISITLNRTSDLQVQAAYQTINGTARSGEDYASTAGMVVFEPGERVQTITVPVYGDEMGEEAETFRVYLSAPINAVGLDVAGVVTILDEDEQPELQPALTIGDALILEGDQSQEDLYFSVQLNRTSNETIHVDFETQDVSAQAGSDYLAVTGRLDFEPGQMLQLISVPVLGDTDAEADETFQVILSNPIGVDLIDGEATGTILDNDEPALEESWLYLPLLQN